MKLNFIAPFLVGVADRRFDFHIAQVISNLNIGGGALELD